jgi:hypothetical protein
VGILVCARLVAMLSKHYESVLGAFTEMSNHCDVIIVDMVHSVYY